MNFEQQLIARSDSKCELCGATNNLTVLAVAPKSESDEDRVLLTCETCDQQISSGDLDVHHWRCLNESMWSQIPAVQVTAWRLLHALRGEGWAATLLDTLYLDEETLAWAKEGIVSNEEDTVQHLDSVGAVLQTGDTVMLIKDLNVKGANFTAKRGKAVRGISLVPNNPEQIEGRVNGQHIVILTKFVKR